MTAHLSQLASDWRGDLPPGGSLAESKIDGWRALWITPTDGPARLWTRQGHPIEGVDHIAHRLRLMEQAAGEPLVIDGEFQVDGTLAATKRWCERGWRSGGEAGLFHAFDLLTLAEWRAGGSDVPSYRRKERLRALWQAVEDDPVRQWEWRPGSHGRDGDASPVIVMPETWLADAGEVLAEARRIWAVGGEGIMLKDAEAPYRRARTSAWRKVKQANFHLWRAAA